MKNGITYFRSNNFKTIRTTKINDQVWFVAKDVCDNLDIKNTTQALSKLDNDERSMFNIGRQGEVNIINEFGLYSLVLSSRKKEAKEFKRWVTHEVIPSIRKHGAYLTPEKIEEAILKPDIMIKLATELKKEQKKSLELSNKIKEQLPIVNYTNKILTSNKSMCITQIAKDYGLTGARLNQILHENRIIYKVNKQWLLYQDYCNMGLTESETIIVNENTVISTKWTQKGRLFIHKLLERTGVLENE